MFCFVHFSKNIPDSHGKRIDIFIKCVKKEDCLNDHIVNTVNIKFHFCPAVTMSQTKLSFFQISRLYNLRKWNEKNYKKLRGIRLHVKGGNHILRIPQKKTQKMLTLRSLRNLSKWRRTPRSSSQTNSLLWHGILVTSKIWEPILGSITPKLNLAFLPSLTFGRLISRKLLNSSVNRPESHAFPKHIHIKHQAKWKNHRIKYTILTPAKHHLSEFPENDKSLSSNM